MQLTPEPTSSYCWSCCYENCLHREPKNQAGNQIQRRTWGNKTVTLSCKGKSAAASKLMAIMGMGVKHGDNVEVTVEGADEDTAAAELQKFFRENL